MKDLDNKVSIKPIYDIFRLGTMNRTKSRNYEIRAIFTGCNSDSIPIYVGYNCDGFPDSLSVADCIDVIDQLNYEIRFIFRRCYYMKPDKADQNIVLLLQLH